MISVKGAGSFTGRRISRLLLAMVAVPSLAAADRTAATTSTLSGTFNRPQENGCIHVSLFYYRVDCAYHRARPTLDGQPVPWVGPTVNSVYYSRGSPHALPSYAPTPDDDRLAPPLTATLTVHRHHTPRGDDDSVSGVFTVGAAARSLTTRTDKNSNLLRVVETWLAIQHTLADTPVTSAARNAAGGYDYVIGEQGFPARLCLTKVADDCFPSAGASLTTDGKWGEGVWAAPAAVSIAASPALGGNVGARTSAAIDGYECSDNSRGSECARGVALWGGAGHAGLDNLVLALSTDARGRLVSVHGFWTTEYRLNAGPPALQAASGQANSWLGGYLELQPVTDR